MVGEDFTKDMDSYHHHEGETMRRTRLRQMCSLCNEPSLPAKEQLKHFTSPGHKHMKRIKQKQYSYTKNLKTLDEKIKAAEEQNEPLIGLEYIYQYTADRRGVVPYVCMLCHCVYKIDTIFFHIVGVKHRSLYMSKNFPAMGIGSNFRVQTPSDYRQLLNAAEVIDNSHGRKKINVFNTFFNPKKNGSIKYALESEGEGLSSSEDEQDNPESSGTTSDNNGRPVNYGANQQFLGDRKDGRPVPDVNRGGPAFRYDRRPGPGVQECHSAMNLPLRNPDNEFSYVDHRDHYEALDISYQQRSSGGRKSPGRRDFMDDCNPRSQMHSDGAEFQFDDRQGGFRHDNHRVRNHDGDSDFQHGQGTRLRGDHHGDFDMPSMGPLAEQVDYDDIKGLNRKQTHPPGFPRDRGLQSQMHGTWPEFQYNDRREPMLKGDPRHPDHQIRNPHVQSNQNTRSLANAPDDYDIPSMEPLHKDNRRPYMTESYPPDFPAHRDGMAFHYNDRRGPMLQGGPREIDNQLRKNDRDFAFQHDQNTQLLGRADDDFAFQHNQSTQWGGPHGDPNMPSVGPLFQQVESDDFRSRSRTQNHPPDISEDHDLGSRMHRNGMEFQNDGRRGAMLRGDPRYGDSQFKNNGRALAFQRDQSPQFLTDAHGHSAMSPIGHEDHIDIKGQNRTHNHPSDLSEDPNLGFRLHRNRMEFQYDDRDVQPRMHRGGLAFGYDDMPQDDPRHCDRQRPELLPNVPAMNSFYQQRDRHAFEDRRRADDCLQRYSGDRSLHSQRHPQWMMHDRRDFEDNRSLIRREFITFRELKAAYVSGIGQGYGSMDEQDVANDSDMEVRSMELSDCDPDGFLCNAELFEFLKTFQILSYEDEQFVVKVRDIFTSSTIRYKNKQEELLKKRIAEEKEKLEEEKKAFLEVQRAKERPKKERPKPSNRNQAPFVSSRPALLPTPTSISIAQGLKPAPLMFIAVDPSCPAEHQSHGGQESIQTSSSEMQQEEPFNVLLQREDLHSRGRVDTTRNLPPRFPPHAGSVKY